MRGASGALKIGGGVLAVVGAVGAVFAVVATGGLAAPIIVGTAVALTTAFAASDVVEGVGDVKAAVTKEGLDKRSYNPIRDDVFGGNELAYALTGTGISLVTDIVTGAVIAKIPERISASMAAKSAKRAAKKAAQDATKAARAAAKAEKAAQTVKVAKTAETVEKTEEAAKAVSAAERFYSELDALKLKAREIPRTLTEEEARACETVKLQMKGEISEFGEETLKKANIANLERSDSAIRDANMAESAISVQRKKKIWNYSERFEGELKNFNPGYQIRTYVDHDLYLVQYHSNGEIGIERSLKYWTTTCEANNISTVEEYMDKMALLKEWGARNHVTVAKVPAGTKVKFAIGTATKQPRSYETRPGGGLQLLFEYFDECWLLETSEIP